MNKVQDLEKLRHSTSHIMAEAVQELFPGTKLAIGPAIEDGFYYDFAKSEPFTPEDLVKIEKRMSEIVKKNYPFIRKEVSKEEAKKIFAPKEEKYKLELLEEIPEAKVTLYEQGPFLDLCKGPHLNSTGEIKYFKLLSIAGAYWRGDEKREMLQRIYGTVFFQEAELKTYLEKLEEAKKRDHRKLGKELGLYEIFEEVGAGLVFWQPKGAIIRKIIEDYWREKHLESGYQLVYIPHIAKLDLWVTSGHWDFYRDYIYSPVDIEGQKYILKPMNCPGHILMYKSQLHSYRELPIRWAELGTVYRYEKSGVLHGLMRVRGFTQDDAHIFCRPDQLEEEINQVLKFVLEILKTFGFAEYEIRLSTRPEKYAGTLENWAKAEDALRLALEDLKLSYTVDPGEGVFYGPKVDIKIKDCLGRSWQCSTVQVDFNLPERFKVTYRNQGGKEETVVMVHRALMGSLERFFGVLIEHYGGNFPLWLSPTQVAVLTITEKQNTYAEEINSSLKKQGLRSEIDLRNEKINLKIREAELKKIPYLLIIGEKEVNAQTVSVRKHGGENLGNLGLEDFVQKIIKEVKEKK
jgi:threonyl-tRNA synthetase